ncbi:MAG: hypothetical protein WCF67_17985 [Chitinophagaceae bacterium]
MHPCQFSTSSDLIEAIERYYPIGGLQERQNHIGFENLENMIIRKITAANDKQPAEWFALVEGIRREWKEHEVRNLASRSFPSYQASVLISKTITSRLQAWTVLTLSLSLLIPYFTFYMREKRILIKQTGETKQRYIISEGQYQPKSIEEKIDLLSTLVRKHYPHYKLAHGHYLLNVKVKYRIAYGGSSWHLGEGVLYDYLIGNEMTGIEFSTKI